MLTHNNLNINKRKVILIKLQSKLDSHSRFRNFSSSSETLL